MNLKKIRIDKSLTMEKLALLSGVSAGMICLIENNKVNPSLKKLKQLAKALNIDVIELLN